MFTRVRLGASVVWVLYLAIRSVIQPIRDFDGFGGNALGAAAKERNGDK